MRPVLQNDIVIAARALLPVAPQARPGLALRMIKEAEAADRYRLRHRKAHALWGNGTLAASAMTRPQGRAGACSVPEFLACQALMIEALLQRQSQTEGAS